jgi:pimeloyl-ACP methyl ester carboxylesterase
MLFSLSLLALGCEQSGTSPDDDDSGVGDDDTTPPPDDDDTSGQPDCLDPDEQSLAELYSAINTYLTVDEPDEAILDQLDGEYAGICFEYIAGAIRAWDGPTPDPGMHDGDYFIELYEETAAYHVYAPAIAEGDRVPLVVWLHGAGADTGATWCNNPVFQQAADDGGFVLACPTCDQLCDWSLSESCGAQSVSLVRHLKRLYPIDDDRVVLTGHSMGGRGSFTIGLTFPSVFAGLLPSAATIGATYGTTDIDTHYEYCRPHVENALNQRVVLHTGMLDSEYLVAQNEGAVLAFEEFGYDFEWMAEADAGHALDPHVWAEGVAMAVQATRDPYPAHVIWNQAEHASSYYPQLFMHTAFNPPEYWLRVDGREDTTAPARIEGAIVGQQVSITTDNVRELAVFLAPEMLDLEQSVTIEVDGELWFEGVVETSPRLALTSARERSERSMVFAVEITGDTPASD